MVGFGCLVYAAPMAHGVAVVKHFKPVVFKFFLVALLSVVVTWHGSRASLGLARRKRLAVVVAGSCPCRVYLGCVGLLSVCQCSSN